MAVTIKEATRAHAAMTEIQRLMDGTEWSADTLEEIAAVLREHGFTVGDYDPDPTPETMTLLEKVEQVHAKALADGMDVCEHHRDPLTCEVCLGTQVLGTTQRCRSAKCGAQIVWCATERGSRMPVDAAPSADGNVQRTGGVAGTSIVKVLSKGALEFAKRVEETTGQAIPRYMPHHATCPDVGSYRR